MSIGACYIRHEFFHSRHFTLSLTSTLYTTLTKVFVTQVCHKHVFIVPSRIVFLLLILQAVRSLFENVKFYSNKLEWENFAESVFGKVCRK